MLATARILASLVSEYIGTVRPAAGDCRLIVPGLTSNIGDEVHQLLRSQDLPSYLVVAEGRPPCKTNRRLYAVSLTTVRIGTFVAVTDPGTLADVRHSIRGSGGAVRNDAYSEEWPWQRSGSEGFDFAKAFVPRLLAEWGIPEAERVWFKDYITVTLLEATRRRSDRAALLLEDILGTFQPQHAGSPLTVAEQFLLHCGVPRPSSLVDPRSMEREICRVLGAIEQAARTESDLRERVRGNIDPSDPLKEELIPAIDDFLDGLGSFGAVSSGILSATRCWGEPKNQESWAMLTTQRLRTLFNVPSDHHIELECSLQRVTGLIISDDGKSAAGSIASTFQIEARFQIPSELFEMSPCRLVAFNRTKRLAEIPIATASGVCLLSVIPEDHALSHRSHLAIRVAILANEDEVASCQLRLHCVGPDRPAILIATPSFHAETLKPDSGEADAQRRIVEGTIGLNVLQYDSMDEPVARTDEDEDITLVSNDGIWQTARAIDLADAPSGRLNVNVSCGERRVRVAYETLRVEKGLFTLEDELRECSASWKKDRLREVLARFMEAGKDPYLKLGGITPQSYRRIVIARLFEEPTGWKPLMLDAASMLDSPCHACGNYVRLLGIPHLARFESLALPPDALDVLQNYSDTRWRFQELVGELLNKSHRQTDHPLYASHPFFVDDTHDDADRLSTSLVGYIEAFIGVQDYLTSHVGRLSWEQLFVLSHLDCAVHWGSGTLQNTIFLFGPWHPLVVAKRHLVQRLLVRRAVSRLEAADRQFCELTSLLRNIAGFHWACSVHNDDERLEPIHVVPTSDPGWHIGFKDAAATAEYGARSFLFHLLECLRASLGLATEVYVPPSGGMVESAVRSYTRTFPSKRHLGLYFPDGFRGEVETVAADRFLHKDDAETEGGAILPGGIDLAFAARPYVSESIEWAKPPLSVYHYADFQKCIVSRHPDIHFCAVNDGVSFTDGQDASLVRGGGENAVLSQGTLRISKSAAGLPRTLLNEWDDSCPSLAGVGGIFAKAASVACRGTASAKALVSKTALPERLATTWTVVPGAVIDPALFVAYVAQGSSHHAESRALWDYRISINDSSCSYFILSAIPAAFRASVSALFGDNTDRSKEFINELGDIGIAIGGEAMKSGRHALGAVGVAGAARLFRDAQGSWSEESISFLIPVDSFRDLLEESPVGDDEFVKPRRADLLAIRLVFPECADGVLRIKAVAIESKFVSQTYSRDEAKDALQQSLLTIKRFRSLCERAVRDDSAPEKLALLGLVKFGMRLASSAAIASGIPEPGKLERRVYRHILTGAIVFESTGCDAALVSTELGLPGDAEAQETAEGMWLRLNKGNWPGVHETASVREVRQAVRRLDLFSSSTQEMTVPRVEAVQLGEPRDDACPQSSSSTAEPVLHTDADMPPGTSDPDDPSSARVIRDGNGPCPTSAAEAIAPRLLEPIQIGTNNDRQPVYFNPHSPVGRLENANVMVTGSPGKGKTQFLKYLICALRDQNANVLVLDFKNDFASDEYFTERGRLNRVFVNFDGLPFNPLIPYPVTDPRTGTQYVQVAQHIAGICSVLRRTLLGGTAQEAAVRQSLRQACQENGIAPTGTVPFDPTMRFPVFTRVGELLEQAGGNTEAYSRMDPLFALGVFRESASRTAISELVASPTVLDFSQIPSDAMRKTLAELVVLSAHAYFNSQAHCGGLRCCIVVDEAHRILDADYIERFALECRAYGVSLVLSSQYPDHFPAAVSACMATKVIHGNDRDRNRVQQIVNMLGCAGRELEIGDLGMFEAICSNNHYRNTYIRTMNYPVYLVLERLRVAGELTRAELSQITGLETDKLSVVSIVSQLQRMGCCEVTSTGIVYRA